MASPLNLLTVWYDGACSLCIREIDVMRRLDKRGAIDFIDVSSENALCPMDRTLLLSRFHAQEADGSILNGAAAFAAMWRAIPLLRPFGIIARNGLVLATLERAYNVFLKVRPRLQALAGR